ncbi:MAG: VPDSG-CTERM-specific exosortase XrtC [Verrucomicrobia bacterium]|nr:VPDSG-CTERM-specific exosortase XrtC [Verrucomicrobiota bacterium]
MNDSPEATASSPRPSFRTTDPDNSAGMRGLYLSAIALLVIFSLPLYRLVRFALGSDLYSHIVLIPVITGYLVWLKRSELVDRSPPRRALAFISIGIGAAILARFGFALLYGPAMAREDILAQTTSSFVFLFIGICAYQLGRKALGAVAFPLGFLFFMVPFPTFVLNGIETFLQYGSASAAGVFFGISGTPVYRQDLVFQLQGIRLQVAPECSGIHSSLALFITSVLGGYFFLRSPVHRTILALAVIPLALVRNGFRVFVLGELCVHIGPEMIDSYIHHHGGPIFFALSLIPFSILLLLLIKSERRKTRSSGP